jgi:hypothetical protein
MEGVRDSLFRGGESFLRRFPGSAHLSFRQGQCENEDIRMVTNSGLRKWTEEVCFSELKVNFINWKYNLVIITVKVFNLDELKSTWQHEKLHAVGTWDHLSIHLKTQNN